MGWTTEWPWSLEEEAEWKAELARREHDADDGSSYDVIRWFPNALANGDSLTSSSIRVLVVDDYALWRRFVSSTLQKQPELQVIGEVSDGLEAVEEAQELQPDLILLDIGLPTLNGIDAARRIRERVPKSKILFVSELRCPDIVREALSTAAGGYVLKSDAASELLPAVKVVLEGKRFISASLAGHFLVGTTLSMIQTMLSWTAMLISGIR